MKRIAKIHALTKRRPAMALLVVVVLTMLIALGAYRFSFYMESQYRLTRLHEEQVHAELAALSGLEMAAAIAELSSSERTARGGVFDNPTFQHRAIGASTEVSAGNQPVNSSWRLGLVAAMAGVAADTNSQSKSTISDSSDASGGSNNLRFGLENESAKLHMPTLLEWDQRFPGHARATLLALPGATEQLVDAWLRGVGITKQPVAANGGSALLDRLESNRESSDQASDTDQLKALWFGADLNQNYRLDPLEVRLSEQLFTPQPGGSRTASANLGPANASASTALPPAWMRFVTWHSGARNETRIGQARVNLNEANLQALHQKLTAIWPADWANFVIAIRQYGPVANAALAGTTTPIATENSSPDFSKPAAFTLKTPLDLIGAVVQVSVTNPQPTADGKSNVTTKRIRNPFSSDMSDVRNYLGRVLDTSTTDPRPFTIGRVDVSQAPAVVLSGVPGIDAALAQRIVQQRTSSTGASSSEPRDTIAWLLEGGLLDVAKLKVLEPYISCRNDVYTVQSVGYRDHLSPVYRCTATIDARQLPAQIRNYQIWHPWDRGFTMDQLNRPAP
jgi:hypothetical protein